MSTAPVPQVVLSDLGGEVVHDATLVAFLVRQTLLEREAEKRKKEQVEEDEEEDKLCTLRASLAQLCGDDWKQRGQGEAKLLRCFSSEEDWFVMRDEQSMKIIARCVDDDCDLDPTGNSGRSLFCSGAVVRNGERRYVFFF